MVEIHILSSPPMYTYNTYTYMYACTDDDDMCSIRHMKFIAIFLKH